MTIDWTRPVRTIGEHQSIEVKFIDGNGEYPIVGYIDDDLISLTMDGKLLTGRSIFVENIPEDREPTAEDVEDFIEMASFYDNGCRYASADLGWWEKIESHLREWVAQPKHDNFNRAMEMVERHKKDIEVAQLKGKCESCGGNDMDAPCAYPSEGKRGCLRDTRLKQGPETIVRYVHIFENCPKTLAEAKKLVCGGGKVLAIKRIEFKEGQFDE